MSNPHRSRSRGKSEPNKVNYFSVIHSGGTTPDLVGEYREPIRPIGTQESMIDTTGFVGSAFNPCSHMKFSYTHMSKASFTLQIGGINWSYSFSEKGPFPSNIQSLIQDALTDPQLPWLDDFSAKAEDHFISAANPTHSLINFIVELIEMCEGNIESLKALSDKVSSALKGFFGFLARNPGKFWLAWNFAIKPTISDVKNMLQVLKNAQKRVAWLKAHNRKPTLVKYRERSRDLEVEPISWSIPINPAIPTLDPYIYTEAAFPIPGFVASLQFEIEFESVKVTPCAHALVTFDIPDEFLEGDLGVGIVASALSGLYQPYEIAWEAIPFSWLIDWFVSEREKLRRFKAVDLNPLPDGQLSNVMYSLKAVALGSVYVSHSSGTGGRVELGQFKATSYSRVPGFPQVDSPIFVLPDTWYQLSILLSIISQRSRR